MRSDTRALRDVFEDTWFTLLLPLWQTVPQVTVYHMHSEDPNAH